MQALVSFWSLKEVNKDLFKMVLEKHNLQDFYSERKVEYLISRVEAFLMKEAKRIRDGLGKEKRVGYDIKYRTIQGQNICVQGFLYVKSIDKNGVRVRQEDNLISVSAETQGETIKIDVLGSEQTPKVYIEPIVITSSEMSDILVRIVRSKYGGVSIRKNGGVYAIPSQLADSFEEFATTFNTVFSNQLIISFRVEYSDSLISKIVEALQEHSEEVKDMKIKGKRAYDIMKVRERVREALKLYEVWLKDFRAVENERAEKVKKIIEGIRNQFMIGGEE